MKFLPLNYNHFDIYMISTSGRLELLYFISVEMGKRKLQEDGEYILRPYFIPPHSESNVSI